MKRGFVDLDEGQLHYRVAGAGEGGAPLVMLPVAPGTSLGLVPLMQQLSARRRIYAFDLPGTGDSDSPAHGPGEEPPLPAFADMLLRACAALGLDRFALYGNRVGAHTAIEMALAAPDRTAKLILDGLFIFPWPTDKVPWTQPYEEPAREDLRNTYTPMVRIDPLGGQFKRTWHFMRDTSLFWPWFVRDAAHVRDVGLPSADVLHDKTLEILRAARTQHLVVRASFDQDWRARCADLDRLAMPVLAEKNVAPFIPRAAVKTSGRYDAWYTVGAKLDALAAELAAFLDA